MIRILPVTLVLLGCVSGCGGSAGDDAGPNSDGGIEADQAVEGDTGTSSVDGGMANCTGRWSDGVQVWRIVWVVTDVTASDGEETYMRVDAASTGTNGSKCLFIDEPTGPDELNCGGINPLRATLDVDGVDWSMVFEVDPEDPGVRFTGTAGASCESVSGTAAYGDERGTFEAALVDVAALGWVVVD